MSGGEYDSEGAAKWGSKCRCVCVAIGGGTDMDGNCAPKATEETDP